MIPYPLRQAVCRGLLILITSAATICCGGKPPTAPDPVPDPVQEGPSAPGPEPSEPPDPEPDPVNPPSGQTPSPAPAPAPMPLPAGPPPPGSPVFVGAGDIAPCNDPAPEQTARLLDRISGTVFTLGDHAYPSATRELFQECYDPTWGRHRDRTRPTIGNHEYQVARAEPYFGYFGENAGPYGRGYYSFQIGEWLVLSLDSMNDGSPQIAWLKATLAANRSKCTIAYWHHPFVASRGRAPRPEAREMWRILYEHDADVILTAHEHFYERYAPQDPNESRDRERGMRQFIVGTGGAPLHEFEGIHPNSEVRHRAHGVLKLTLGPASYGWEFVTPSGVLDAGDDACH